MFQILENTLQIIGKVLLLMDGSEGGAISNPDYVEYVLKVPSPQEVTPLHRGRGAYLILGLPPPSGESILFQKMRDRTFESGIIVG